MSWTSWFVNLSHNLLRYKKHIKYNNLLTYKNPFPAYDYGRCEQKVLRQKYGIYKNLNEWQW